jgi:hypothetical protein
MRETGVKKMHGEMRAIITKVRAQKRNRRGLPKMRFKNFTPNLLYARISTKLSMSCW